MRTFENLGTFPLKTLKGKDWEKKTIVASLSRERWCKRIKTTRFFTRFDDETQKFFPTYPFFTVSFELVFTPLKFPLISPSAWRLVVGRWWWWSIVSYSCVRCLRFASEKKGTETFVSKSMVESSRVRRRREQRVCAKLNARYQYSRETTRRDASLLFLSLNSLSRDWWQNRALKMWWFFVVGKVTKVRWEKKNLANDTSVFFICAPPQNNSLLPKTRNNNETEYSWNKNETRTKQEWERWESIYFLCMRVCVCRNSAVLLFSQTRNSSFAFLVLREFLSLVTFDIVRISPRGERARFALNSKRNLRNVLDPVKRFFPRRWRLW